MKSIQEQINIINAEIRTIDTQIVAINNTLSTLQQEIDTINSGSSIKYASRVSQISVFPGSGSVNLGLNQIPILFRASLQCLATELNYNAGDRVILNPETVSLSADDNYLYFIKPASFVIPYKDGSGSPTSINTANWYLEIISFYVAS